MAIITKKIIEKMEKGKIFANAYEEVKDELCFTYNQKILLTRDHIQSIIQIKNS